MPSLPMPDDWQRALVVAAHPDDIEYGAAAAVAVWTAAGKEVHYLLATRGEAGIAGMHPDAAGPLREEGGRRSAAAAGGSQGGRWSGSGRWSSAGPGRASWGWGCPCPATWPPRSAGTGRSWW